ncbi:D-isomer specific 2-hydroxyacid dehydrogenase catalytic domain [Arabidopsis thaliana x Arabidopsis arenosa]|uniref:Formate dehydrogenase, mitochondrial n=1 Tax=Arabidopsis thaliana x Arabidopsis arenosa TaxID=1240361 RepID=A0A8T1ZJ17_9BRAS|nr:D-isomer specific 2-hydroxyacid dehydrogenase catalytic domain [Arabidopsis thaliana x Arabidopsis arenosa]
MATKLSFRAIRSYASAISSGYFRRNLHASSSDTKKIVGVFYKANEYAYKNPNFLGCVENALGIRDWLESQGHQYVVTDDKEGPCCELEKHIPDLHVLISTPFHPAYVTAERINKAKNLQLLLTAGIGSDHIDLHAAAAAGLTVAEVTGSNVVSVAEDELMRILLLMRNFLPGYNQVINGEWNVASVAYRAYDLEGKTIGTVGAGRIGKLLLQRLKPFGCNLLYHDRLRIEPEQEEQIGAIHFENLNEMLPKCDVIVFNIPLTNKTKGMFNKEMIGRMKRGVLIVNNARAAIMDEQAVVEAVKSGQIGGYSGDVWDPQPAPKDHPWRFMPNQAMTPHISGTTIDAQASSSDTKKIVGVFYKANEYAYKNPNFLGCVENALGIRDWLESQGHQYVFTDDKEGPCCELEKHIPDLHVLISTPFHPAYVTAERIKKAKNLQLLLTAGVGSDHIDLHAAAAAGLTVAEVTGSNVVSVAEDELMRILLLMRNFLPGYNQVINGEWNVASIAYRAYDLEGKTIGTVGAGRIGKLLLQRLKPFGCNLLYHDRLRIEPEQEEQIGAIHFENLNEMLPKCDVIVFNIPLTKKTKGMFNKEMIGRMKRGVLIVNNARAAIMDEQAVVEAVKSGHIGGYSGDVWDPQPAPKDHPWRFMPNQAMTPHISGTTIDAQASSSDTKKIVGVFYKANEYAYENPNFLGCVENALGIRDWLESQGHQYVVTDDKEGPCCELEKHIPDLHLLLTAGVGSDHIDLHAAAAAGLTVAEVTGSNVVSVAEDELMRILLLMRNFLPGYNQVINGEWNVASIAYRAYDLEGKTIGTVGAGRIGKLLLQRLKPFGCNLLYHDRLRIEPEQEEQIGAIHFENLNEMLPKCDRNVQQRNDRENEKRCLIVNNARAAIMDEQAVVEAVKSGHIGGYSGDVWDPQPAPKDHPWRFMPNQAMTPHISGTTIDAQASSSDTKKIVGVFYKANEYAYENPNFLGCVENALGIRDWLESQGHQYVVTDDKEGPCYLHVLISTPFHPAYVTAERIKKAKNLQLLLTAGVGSDHIDLHAAAAAGLTVAEVTGSNVINGEWNVASIAYRAYDLEGKTIGTVGAGRIGKLYYSVFNIPLTKKTKGMFNKEMIGRMKRGVLIVNNARAAIMDEQAVVEAVKSGHIGGYSGDVWDPQPAPKDHPWRFMPNQAMTPHILAPLSTPRRTNTLTKTLTFLDASRNALGIRDWLESQGHQYVVTDDKEGPCCATSIVTAIFPKDLIPVAKAISEVLLGHWFSDGFGKNRRRMATGGISLSSLYLSSNPRYAVGGPYHRRYPPLNHPEASYVCSAKRPSVYASLSLATLREQLEQLSEKKTLGGLPRYNVSYVYHAMYAYFDRGDIALKGLNKYFIELSDEERARREVHGVSEQERRKSKTPPDRVTYLRWDPAMELALSLEKLTNEKLLNLHSVATENNDTHLADFVESKYLEEQVEAIKKISDYITQLRMVGKSHGVIHNHNQNQRYILNQNQR